MGLSGGRSLCVRLSPKSAVSGSKDRVSEREGEKEKAIVQWMQARGGDPVGFVELLDGVRFDAVKGLLAVILGKEFFIDRVEGSEFYDGAGIVVELKHDEIAESLCFTALKKLAISA